MRRSIWPSPSCSDPPGALDLTSLISTPTPKVPRVDRRTIHRGVKFDLEMLSYPGARGDPVHREFLRHPGSVILLPILPDGRIVFIRNFRASIERTILELPAGTRGKGEDPARCAHRELIEETGYRSGRLEHLTNFYIAPGLADEVMWAFVARDLTHVGVAPEDDELMTVHPVDPGAALKMIDDRTIEDAKTMLVLLLAHRRGLI